MPQRTLIAMTVSLFLLAAPRAIAADDAHSHGMGQKAMSDQTLKQVMQGIQGDLSRIVYGVSVDNMHLVAQGARGIAHHPMPKGGMKPYITKNADKLPAMIPKMDEMVHQSAVKIAGAADAGDRDAVVDHLSTMIKGCVACHQTFR